MTDRLYAVTVLFDRDIREDDAQQIIDAISMIKGVSKVGKHVTNVELWAATERARMELTSKLWEVLHPKKD